MRASPARAKASAVRLGTMPHTQLNPQLHAHTRGFHPGCCVLEISRARGRGGEMLRATRDAMCVGVKEEDGHQPLWKPCERRYEHKL